MSLTTTTGGIGLVPQPMDQAVRLAKMLTKGRLVPNHLQQSPGDCLMVIEQAMRWGMSPFAVAQSTSVIQGKLMFEGKLVAAARMQETPVAEAPASREDEEVMP